MVSWGAAHAQFSHESFSGNAVDDPVDEASANVPVHPALGSGIRRLNSKMSEPRDSRYYIFQLHESFHKIKLTFTPLE